MTVMPDLVFSKTESQSAADGLRAAIRLAGHYRPSASQSLAVQSFMVSEGCHPHLRSLLDGWRND